MQKGIDVSKWQGTINWQSVAADGVEFAMIRLGYGTKNGGAPDPKFRQNMEGALAAGIDAGVYFYGTAVTEEAARAEAHFVLTALEPWRGRLAYPVAYDAEDSAQETLTKNKLTAVIAAFCDTVRAAGWYPMVYSSRYWLENKIHPAQIRADVWLAQWAQEATYAGEYGLWQCSDSAATAQRCAASRGMWIWTLHTRTIPRGYATAGITGSGNVIRWRKFRNGRGKACAGPWKTAFCRAGQRA